jgi:hypothetical protein
MIHETGINRKRLFRILLTNLAFRWASKNLDYNDLISEAAAAIFMVVIINGYVSLAGIRTQF